MPYVKRDDTGQIVAMSFEPMDGFDEQVADDAPEFRALLSASGLSSSLDDTDQDFVRVLEDIINLLIDKGVILFTELPQSAQDKMMQRQRLRSALSGKLNLIGDD